METGTGIFLAALFFGLIWLVSKKGGGVRWGRLFLGIVTLVIFTAGGLALYAYWENQPKLSTSYWGLTIGESRQDVLFKKGQPYGSDVKGNREVMVYQPDRSFYVVRLTNGKIDFVIIDLCDEKDRYISGPSLQGISSFSTSAEILAKFGQPKKEHLSDTGLRRTFNYPQYGVTFGLVQDKVCSLGAIDPAGKGVQF